MSKFYFYCEKYKSDGFWDCLEYGRNKKELVMNYTYCGMPLDDVEEIEVIELEGEEKEIEILHQKVLDIIENRNLEKLKADPLKSKGELSNEVYFRMMKKLGYTVKDIMNMWDEQEKNFLDWMP